METEGEHTTHVECRGKKLEKKSHEDFAILISLLLQLEKDISVISVLEKGRINIIRNAGRGMGKRIWKEYVQCL